MRQLDRRTVLGFGSLAMAGCANDAAYFGNTQPPSRQELRCAVFSGTGTVDPAKTSEFITDGLIIRSIFETPQKKSWVSSGSGSLPRE